MDWAVVLALGLVLGSFLTVVVERLPAGRSVLWPRSACSHCGGPLAARDLVPVLSWLWLRGRCRECRRPIPAYHVLLEVSTALAWAAAYAAFGPTWWFAHAALLLTVLLAVTAIDVQHYLIPNRLLAGAGAVLVPLTLGGGLRPWTDALVGAVVGGGLLLAIAVASRGGMGGGDVKLGALLGCVLGWRMALVALVAAFLAGAVVALLLLATGRKGRRDALPFGPFLALGAAVALFWGDALWQAFVVNPPP